MTPGARVAAVIELLEAIDGSDAPAERVLGDYLRNRRYIGAKDRRALGDQVFAVSRAKARLAWWLARLQDGAAATPDEKARRLMLAALTLIEGQGADAVARHFDGSRYHPAPLSAAEQALLGALAGQPLSHPEQPPAVRAEVPDWLWPECTRAFGDETAAELLALTEAAPLDLRVNSLRADREAARAALAAEAIEAAPTPLSPLGLRVAGRRAVTGTRAFRDGLVEVQDEGSQLLALLVEARPGMAVADLCAGAGGKTLALAAAMENRGRLLACDSAGARLALARPRLRRAGVTIVETRVLDASASLAGEPSAFDRVLVDAPCSGSGTWRRQPDGRWRLTPERLAAYRTAQAALLGAAAALVGPGGRLVYATCSLLPGENAQAVEAFLSEHGDFEPLPAETIWQAILGAPPAGISTPFDGPFLQLTPARHGTDGFFAALLARRAAP